MTEHEQGVQDCKDGIPHKMGSSYEYTLGYSKQHEIEAKQGVRQ